MIHRGQPVDSDGSEKFEVLDVGCGNAHSAKGNVNVDCFKCGFNKQVGDQTVGELVEPKKIKNFVVADAAHLPFTENAFKNVYSSHVIEHVADPQLMLQEIYRVTQNNAVIRYPHKQGSGAKRPYHIQFLDEQWFSKTTKNLGIEAHQNITLYDYPISNRLHLDFLKGSMMWRVLRKIEPVWLNESMKIPFEGETRIRKTFNIRTNDAVKFFVFYNDIETLKKGFLKSTGNPDVKLMPTNNTEVPARLNREIARYQGEECWFVFCHQDLVLHQDLKEVLKDKDASCVYGITGENLKNKKPIGQIRKGDTGSGFKKSEPSTVQMIDEICLIVHSTIFDTLRFDEQFNLHFYAADLCLQAFRLGLEMFVLPVDCECVGKSLMGNSQSKDYLDAKQLFQAKWHAFLPIRTRAGIITE